MTAPANQGDEVALIKTFLDKVYANIEKVRPSDAELVRHLATSMPKELDSRDPNAARAHDVVRARAKLKEMLRDGSVDLNDAETVKAASEALQGRFSSDIVDQVIAEKKAAAPGRTTEISERFAAKEKDYEKRKQEAEANHKAFNELKPTKPLVLKVSIGGSGNDAWRTHCDVQGALDIDQTMKKRKNTVGASNTVYYARDKQHSWDFSGPGAPGARSGIGKIFGGASDTGPNSISNLAEQIPPFIKGVYDASKTAPEDAVKAGCEPQEVIILVKGHSRGAVAAAHVANAIKGQIPEGTVELVQVDPVPGPLQPSKNHEVDVGTLDESTVVYSIYSGHGAQFTPETVLGAKRLIISPQSHGVGIQNGFYYNDRLYKGSRLNSLPEGVYKDSSSDISRPGTLSKVSNVAGIRNAFVAVYEEQYGEGTRGYASGKYDANPDSIFGKGGDRKVNVETALDNFVTRIATAVQIHELVDNAMAVLYEKE